MWAFDRAAVVTLNGQILGGLEELLEWAEEHFNFKDNQTDDTYARDRYNNNNIDDDDDDDDDDSNNKIDDDNSNNSSLNDGDDNKFTAMSFFSHFHILMNVF